MTEGAFFEEVFSFFRGVFRVWSRGIRRDRRERFKEKGLASGGAGKGGRLQTGQELFACFVHALTAQPKTQFGRHSMRTPLCSCLCLCIIGHVVGGYNPRDGVGDGVHI